MLTEKRFVSEFIHNYLDIFELISRKQIYSTDLFERLQVLIFKVIINELIFWTKEILRFTYNKKFNSDIIFIHKNI